MSDNYSCELYINMRAAHFWPVPKQYRKPLWKYVAEYVVEVSKYHHNFVLDPASEPADIKLEDLVEMDFEMSNYFQGREIPVLRGRDYAVLRFEDRAVLLGGGASGYTILIRDRDSKELLAAKFIKESSGYSLKHLLVEYMCQERAYKALRGKSCQTPRPVGFLRLESCTDDVLQYVLVSEFCSVIPGVGIGMALEEVLFEPKYLIRTEEFKYICLALIEAVEALQIEGIAHIDIKQNNIMLQFTLPPPSSDAIPEQQSNGNGQETLQENQETLPSNSEAAEPDKETLNGNPAGSPPSELSQWHPHSERSLVHPFLIDYGVSRTEYRGINFPVNPQIYPHIAPELCSEYTVLPHVNTDLHGVAFVLLQIGKRLGMGELAGEMESFLKRKPDERSSEDLKTSVETHFNNRINQQNEEETHNASSS